MSLPSSTEASVSVKKLQCASWRPSQASLSPPPSRKVQRRAPAVAGLVRDQRHRGVLAVDARVWVARVLRERVHQHHARQPPSVAAVLRGEVEDVLADAADLVLDAALEGERVGVGHPRVGPEHELVVVVAELRVERPRRADEVDRALAREALAHGGRAARARRARCREVERGKGRGGARRERDDGVVQRRGRVEAHFDAAAGQQGRLRRHLRGVVEVGHAAPGHREGEGLELTKMPPLRLGSRSAKNSAARGGPDSTRPSERSSLPTSPRVKVRFPVRVHESRAARRAEEAEAERQLLLGARVVGEREPSAQVGAEARAHPGHVVAALAVGLEAQAYPAEVEVVCADHERAVVVQDRDVAGARCHADG
jgi:hypothetical protein